MNSLPHELLEAIVSHLGDDKLAPFATISVTFQELIECRTFRWLEINSTDIDQFLAVVTGSRRRALRRLDYWVVLPDAAERQRNNLSFTQAVHDLFSALSLWDTGSSPKPIDLNISVAEDNTNTQSHRHSILELTAIDSLPSVPQIHTLLSYGDFCISPSSWISIASRLPNLERLDVDLSDNNHQRPGLDLDQRRHIRHNLAEALNNLNTGHLVHINLISPAVSWCRPFRHTPSILLPDNPTDHLSLALNRLLRCSPNLRTIDVSGAIRLSPALFADASNTTTTVSSPCRLERISICFATCAPNGTPYFLGDITSDPADIANYAENSSSDPHDRGLLYRWTGAAESLRPFVLAAARFASADRMPRLRALTLETQFDHCSFEYAAPGVLYPPACEECPWLISGGLKPDPLGDENLWLPRSYIDARGFDEGDAEITEAWGRIREGGLVHWWGDDGE